jgi:hypothetical protein
VSKKLVQVHSKEPQRVWCSHCDVGESIDTNIWYEVKDPKDHIEMYQKYLPCCLQKVGVVVDWEDENTTRQPK